MVKSKISKWFYFFKIYIFKSVYLIIGILADAIALGQGKIANYIGKTHIEDIIRESKNQHQ